jgi:hypothetical protein
VCEKYYIGENKEMDLKVYFKFIYYFDLEVLFSTKNRMMKIIYLPEKGKIR